MSLIANNIKGIIAIKIKPRHDSYTDQFTRIFMPKMVIIASLVMGVDWFHDTVACMVPKDSHLSGSFVHSACWIQGFYVYPQMKDRLDDSSYYGIPRNMDFNGQSENGKLCQTTDRTTNEIISSCKPMAKRYYLQYQWMPFYIASLALLYYLPYVLFRVANTDMVSLKETLQKGDKEDAQKIVASYFNYQVNSPMKLKFRVVFNFINKIIYVVVNVIAFKFTDDMLYNNFSNYGLQWAQWLRLDHITAFDFYVGNTPKPGNVLLPSFGFCEIQEASMDIRNIFFNKNKFICEISPNILYQYTFIVLWFCMVISIAVSIIGVLLNVTGHLFTLTCFVRSLGSTKQVYRSLTLRECEYLTYIRRKNIPLYGETLRQLKMSKAKPNANQSPLLKRDSTFANQTYHPKKGTAPPESPLWTKL